MWSSTGRGRVRVLGLDSVPGSLWYVAAGKAGGIDELLIAASANEFTGDTVLVPNRVIRTLGAGGRARYLGMTPDFAMVCTDFCEPGDVLIYGAEEWQVFPVDFKGVRARWNESINSNNLTGSGSQGYAYRIRR